MRAMPMPVLALVAVVFFGRASGEPATPDQLGTGNTPPAAGEPDAYGRLDVEFLSIPSEELEGFKDLFDGARVSDLPDILKKSGGKVVFSASTGIRTGAGPTTIQIGNGQFVIVPKVIPPDQLSVEGRFSGTVSSSFNSVLQSGYYQLLVILDQPSRPGTKDSFNAIIARMPKIEGLDPGGPSVELTPFRSSGTPDPHSLPPAVTALGDSPPAPPAALAPANSGRLLYFNAGDNTRGFAPGYGNVSFSVHNHALVGASGGGWSALPVLLEGNFEFDYDVYGDSGDVDSDIVFVDEELNNVGILVNNCPQNTDTPTVNILSNKHLNDQGFYFDSTRLSGAPSTRFPNCTWTHVRIIKKGNILTDDVGGQVISANLEKVSFPISARLGLGYYATQNLGGTGQIRYANLRLVQLPDEASDSCPAAHSEPTTAVKSSAYDPD
jgi:hypothetical protein